MLEKADALQAVAKCLTRVEAGKKLATLCKPCAQLVKAADAAEDAGQPEIWLPMLPLWDIDLLHARIDERWAEDPSQHAFGLDRVLKSLMEEIHEALDYEDIELVFDRRQARAGMRPSILGCHTLRVLDPLHFLWTMKTWVLRISRQDWASATLARFGPKRSRHPKTQLVVNLLHVLGLRAPRGPGTRFEAEELTGADTQEVRDDEPLLSREYVAGSLSARRQV